MAVERLKDLQTLRIGSDDNFSLWLWIRHRHWVIRCVTRSEASQWQVPPCWGLESERSARWGCEGISHGIKGEPPRIAHGSDDCRGRKEVHGLDVSIVPGAKVSVERSEDGYEEI